MQGDTTVRFLELAEKEPWLTDGSVDGVEQVRGAALTPKRALDVMACEVNRLLVLTAHALIPLPYIVPRKVSAPRSMLLVSPPGAHCSCVREPGPWSCEHVIYSFSCANFH